ncbi:peptidase S8/S53 domain-containing protein, partial [Syncephalis pseudoplumigaleata]
HVATGVSSLHAEGHYGGGIMIGVIDSGVDYTHPALGGCFGTGCKVAYGYDFVGDNYDGSNTPQPDDDPKEECTGANRKHGTMVAGIIAAKTKSLVGVAPDAVLGAYRVTGCNNKASAPIVAAAM